MNKNVDNSKTGVSLRDAALKVLRESALGPNVAYADPPKKLNPAPVQGGEEDTQNTNNVAGKNIGALKAGAKEMTGRTGGGNDGPIDSAASMTGGPKRLNPEAFQGATQDLGAAPTDVKDEIPSSKASHGMSRTSHVPGGAYPAQEKYNPTDKKIFAEAAKEDDEDDEDDREDDDEDEDEGDEDKDMKNVKEGYKMKEDFSDDDYYSEEDEEYYEEDEDLDEEEDLQELSPGLLNRAAAEQGRRRYVKDKRGNLPSYQAGDAMTDRMEKFERGARDAERRDELHAMTPRMRQLYRKQGGHVPAGTDMKKPAVKEEYEQQMDEGLGYRGLTRKDVHGIARQHYGDEVPGYVHPHAKRLEAHIRKGGKIKSSTDLHKVANGGVTPDARDVSGPDRNFLKSVHTEVKRRMKINEEYEPLLPEDIIEIGIGAVNVNEHMAALLGNGGNNLSEEFKEKTSVVFEAALREMATTMYNALSESFAHALDEAATEYEDALTEHVDNYLGYVVEQWIAENEVAIESGLRSELTEEFITGLHKLFVESYIDVPESKIDMIEALTAKVNSLEEKLNEEFENSVSLRNELLEAKRGEIFSIATKDLTDVQADKLWELSKKVVFEDVNDYAKKIETLKESYFSNSTANNNKSSSVSALDSVDSAVAETVGKTESYLNEETANPRMARYVRTLSNQVNSPTFRDAVTSK